MCQQSSHLFSVSSVLPVMVMRNEEKGITKCMMMRDRRAYCFGKVLERVLMSSACLQATRLRVSVVF